MRVFLCVVVILLLSVFVLIAIWGKGQKSQYCTCLDNPSFDFSAFFSLHCDRVGLQRNVECDASLSEISNCQQLCKCGSADLQNALLPSACMSLRWRSSGMFSSCTCIGCCRFVCGRRCLMFCTTSSITRKRRFNTRL